jgi:hypothetical protein
MMINTDTVIDNKTPPVSASNAALYPGQFQYDTPIAPRNQVDTSLTNPNNNINNLSAQTSTNVVARPTPLPTALNYNKLTYDQMISILGSGGVGQYFPIRNPDGTYTLRENDVRQRSEQLNQGAVVSSSDGVRNQNNQVTQAVQAINPAPTGNTLVPPGADEQGARNASASYQAELDRQIAALEARRTAEIAAINAGFDAERVKTERAQTNETGSTTATLARIGGYLGGTASHTGALLNLAQTHRDEIASLEGKRQAAINQANMAITDKQFALARAKVQEVKDVEAEIYKRKQDFFDNSIKLQQENRNQDEARRNQIKDDLEMLSLLDPKEITQDKKTQIDSFYGVPGFTDKYLAATSAAAKAENEKDILEAQKKMLDILKDIPAGQTVKFPDGTEYTGIGSAGDITTYMQTDDSGNSYLVAHNKVTGQTTAQSVGRIGKSKTVAGSGGSAAGGVNGVSPTVVDNTVNKIQIALETNGKSGSYYDPDIYIALREELKTNTDYGPKLLKYIDNLFLNKNNEFFSADGIQQLRKKGIFYNAEATFDSGGTTTVIVDNTSDTQGEDDQL